MSMGLTMLSLRTSRRAVTEQQLPVYEPHGLLPRAIIVSATAPRKLRPSRSTFTVATAGTLLASELTGRMVFTCRSGLDEAALEASNSCNASHLRQCG